MLSDDACYELVVARDPRGDGVFFVGVRTTGIYCRPICPARTPGRSRCAFFSTAVEAEAAGFRACFRCRPELAPGNASIDRVDILVARATERIAEGALAYSGGYIPSVARRSRTDSGLSLDELAAELGVTARHLRRAIKARLGVSPFQIAQSRRLAVAKQLLADTSLPIATVAHAAGFGSVRRFNASFAATMGIAPSALRTASVPRLPMPGVTLRLDYRPPYDWERLLAFFRDRAMPGVESVDDRAYRRVVAMREATGAIAVRQVRGRMALELEVEPTLLPVIMPLVAAVRRMFDLDARPDLIAAALTRDRLLAPMVKARPGLRLPGAIDPFEVAIRALLGQHVSVAAATTLAGRFAAQFGTPIDLQQRGLRFRFPTPAQVVAAGADRIVKIGMPMARATAIHSFAGAVVAERVNLHNTREFESFVDALVELPGIGPWTAHYIAMRALHAPDAFPASDLGIQKALRSSSTRTAAHRAAAWRPYRSYAVMHLWASLGESQ